VSECTVKENSLSQITHFVCITWAQLYNLCKTEYSRL